MIKTILIIAVLAIGVYIGMNWDELTGELKSDGIDMVDGVKERAEETVQDIVDKVKP